MYLLKLLISILFSQLGEGEGEEGGDAGQGGAPAGDEGGEGKAPGAEGEEGAEGGEGAAKDPKYGQFGDEPDVDAMYQALQDAASGLEGLKSKTTQTEKNSASVNKALESSGLKILTDGDGNVTLVPNVDSATKRESRFKDSHKELFEPNVLEAIQHLVADGLDGFRDEMRSASGARTKFQQAQIDSNNQMIKLYPQLDAGGDQYDQAFYDKATELWQGDPQLKKNPKGELMAASLAAAELGISPLAVQKAKKAGYQQGSEGKKILGPAGQHDKAGGGGVRHLSKEEYLKLSPDEREDYDKKTMK